MIGLLLFLIAVGKVHPFPAFLLVALLAALMTGLPPAKIVGLLERGIARTAICFFGERRLSLALSATGFIVGVPLHYNVAFVLLIPLIFSLLLEAAVHQRSRCPVEGRGRKARGRAPAPPRASMPVTRRRPARARCLPPR